jgi:hypothetical protein
VPYTAKESTLEKPRMYGTFEVFAILKIHCLLVWVLTLYSPVCGQERYEDGGSVFLRNSVIPHNLAM